MRISDWSSDVCSSDLEVVQKLGEAMSRMAAGDFSVSMDDLPDGYSKLSDDFNAMAAQMRSILGAVANSAESTHTGSSEISSAADDLARRTDILLRPGVRIERIISTGTAKPTTAPNDQDHDE